MSSHSYSVSGQRPASLQLNGGHVTGMTCPSRRTDSLTFNCSAFSKIELSLFGKVRIERRAVTRREGEEPMLIDVLVIEGAADNAPAAGTTLYAFAPEPGASEEAIGGENTSLDVRKVVDPAKFGPMAYSENVEVVEAIPLEELFAKDDEG